MTHISRRSMLKLIGAGAAAACAPFSVKSALAGERDDKLNILCWEGYNSAEVLDPFRAAFKAEVHAESATNDPTMVNKLRAGETRIWDLVNVNNPWARAIMGPEGLIKPLNAEEFKPFFEKLLPTFKYPYEWAMSLDGSELLGMPQRFGPFNFVVNTDRISRATAEEQGWHLWDDSQLDGKFGIQESDDWNVFDIFLIAGIDPFRKHSPEELEKFSQTARRVIKGCRIIGDISALNQALVNGEIDAYLSGGTYTASLARLEGFLNIRAISPFENSVMWVEITSLVNNPVPSPLAAEFLKYVQDPEVAHTVALAEGTFNPVAQMGSRECFELFSAEELDAIQYDSLEEEMARSMAYNIVPDYDEAHALLTEAKRLK